MLTADGEMSSLLIGQQYRETDSQILPLRVHWLLFCPKLQNWEVSAHPLNSFLTNLKATEQIYSWGQIFKEGGQEDVRSTGLCEPGTYPNLVSSPPSLEVPLVFSDTHPARRRELPHTIIQNSKPY